MIKASRVTCRAIVVAVIAASLYGCVSNPPQTVAETTFNPVYAMPSDALLMVDVNSARPMVNNMLQTIACERDPYNTSRLVRFATPDSYLNRFAHPKLGMRHHRAGCLDVLSVEGWQRAAKNAIRFSAKFVSPESGEGAMTNFLLYRQLDGRWLASF